MGRLLLLRIYIPSDTVPPSAKCPLSFSNQWPSRGVLGKFVEKREGNEGEVTWADVVGVFLYFWLRDKKFRYCLWTPVDSDPVPGLPVSGEPAARALVSVDLPHKVATAN